MTNNSSVSQLSHYSSDVDDEEDKEKPQILHLESKIQQLDRDLKLLENPSKKSTRCEICKTDLKSYMHAKTHYVSIRHKKIFEEVKNGGVKEILEKAQNKRPFYCKVCDEIVPGNISSLENHLNSEEHKKHLKSYCLVCDFMVESAEVLIEHEKGNHTLIRKLSGLTLSEHSENVGKTYVLTENNNIIIRKQNTKDESEMIEKTENEASNNIKTIQTMNNSDILYYCYLCKIEFPSKILHNAHCFSFPHIQVSKWKSEVVSLGVPYAEYWIHSKNLITCTLCDTKILTPASFKAHNEKTEHQTHLAEWCQAFATWKFGDLIDPKYFYCPLCNVSLLGTTLALDHYDSTEHCELRTDQSLFEHEMPLKAEKNKCFNTLNNNMSPETPESFHEPTCSARDEKNYARLAEEMEKLIDTLYYSKKVPSDVALKCLKKVNSEMDELKRKYEKCQDLGQETPVVRSIFSSDKKSTKEYKLESFISDNHTGEGLLRVTIEEKKPTNNN